MLHWRLEGNHLHSSKVLSMQPSPLWHSALWTLASLAFSDSICSTQRELWALLGFPLLKSSLEALKAVSGGNYRAHFIYFLSLRDHCSSFPDDQCLKCQFYIFCLCWCFTLNGKLRLLFFFDQRKKLRY